MCKMSPQPVANSRRAKPYGFELTFTQPFDPKTAADLASYKMQTFTYIYRADYGSPEVDKTKPELTKVEVAPDNKSVKLHVNGLQIGHIHDLQIPGLRSATGLPLLHRSAYYTLNYIPKKE